MSKLTPILSIAMLLVLSVLAGCQPVATEEPTIEPEETQLPIEPTAVPTEKPEEPVTLRVGGVHDIDCWNPFGCSEVYNFLYFYVNESFMGYGKNITALPLRPQIAESMDVSEDGKTWTIYLRDGVTFSDGVPVNAQTVIDDLNWRQADENLRYYTYVTQHLTSIEALDDLTVQLTTDIPMLSFPLQDVWLSILPMHIWGGLKGEEIFTFENFPPVGTGPFTVADWSPGQYIIYDARDDYYLGKPPIDRIVYQIYANNDAMVQAFLSGQVDVLNTQPVLPPSYYDALVASKDTTVMDLPPGPHHFLAINLSKDGKKHPALEDLRVRQAIDFAVDRGKMVDVALLGHGVPCPTNYACGPAFADFINADLKLTPHDPEHAMQILEEAGYTDQDGDGIREDAGGVQLKLRLDYIVEDPVQGAIAEIARDSLQEIGIGVDLAAVEYTTLFELLQKERDYDLAVMGYGPEPSPVTGEFYYACWAAESSSSWNFSHFCDPEMDKMLSAMTAAASPEEFQAASFGFQEILNTQLPHISLVGQNVLQAFHTDKFEFDTEVMVGLQGVWDPQNIMNIKVK
jgi:peptide/nickel transport system substrate-binding protein